MDHLIFCGGICRECVVRFHEYRFRTYRGIVESRLLLGLNMMTVFLTIWIGLLELSKVSVSIIKCFNVCEIGYDEIKIS